MSSELLSICIPTRNRAPYLREILDSFARQVREQALGPEEVAFYISDNAADDETPAVAREFASRIQGVAYSRNETNIGADRNNLHVRTLARGGYLWVVGDDELIADNALSNLLR